MQTKSEFHQFLEARKSPQKNFPAIHIGGTNGKGSVSYKVARALYLHYKVGLFTSPHLYEARERICINGQCIDEKELDELVAATPSEWHFFDRWTAAAFMYFSAHNVDVAVIEVGLGGRLDATNCLNSIATAIVSIDFDHTEILGNTLEAIAYEKAGIIKEGVPNIVGPTAKMIPGFLVEGPFSSYDEENTAVAARVLQAIEKQFPKQDKKALTERPLGRYEIVGTCVYDVAHNPAGLRALVKNLQKDFPGQTWHFILALSASKDLRSCFEELIPVLRSIEFPLIAHERLAAVSVLKNLAKDYGFLEKAGEKDFVCVTGSFFLLAQLRPRTL